jgi:hypothetical protein
VTAISAIEPAATNGEVTALLVASAQVALLSAHIAPQLTGIFSGQLPKQAGPTPTNPSLQRLQQSPASFSWALPKSGIVPTPRSYVDLPQDMQISVMPLLPVTFSEQDGVHRFVTTGACPQPRGHLLCTMVLLLGTSQASWPWSLRQRARASFMLRPSPNFHGYSPRVMGPGLKQCKGSFLYLGGHALCTHIDGVTHTSMGSRLASCLRGLNRERTRPVGVARQAHGVDASASLSGGTRNPESCGRTVAVGAIV